MARILVVDDEPAIADALRRVLERDGHTVCVRTDPTEVLRMDLAVFDLLISDVMMPGLDGFELVRGIRDRVDAPILFLTAKVSEDDAVVGLGMGADDYLRKPFGAAELRAKVQAHLRREAREHHSFLSFDHGRIRVDLAACEIAVQGATVPLTPTEYGICEYLARHPGQVYGRAQLREAVLGWDSEAGDETVSAHVSNARVKLRRVGADPIATVWGVGYKWQVNDEA